MSDQIFVGSTNPVKIKAAKRAAAGQWPEVEVTGFDVSSGISDQPFSDQETRQGAVNRAQAALEQGLRTLGNLKNESSRTVGGDHPAQSKIPDPSCNTVNEDRTNAKDLCLGIGLEGGVFVNQQDEVWSTVWAAVTDQAGNMYPVNGSRLKIPEILAKPLRAGRELGPVLSEMFDGREVSKEEGMFGIITNNLADRTEMYTAVAKLALGLWYGRDWQAQIK